MKVLISCGGTGGHIYPAIAVAERLRDADILFIGTKERLEENIIKKYGFSFKSISMDRKNIFKILKGIIESFGVIMEFKPDIVFTTGGYVTLPMAIAAIVKRIPLVLHEANSIPGRTNRFLGKQAVKVAITYKNSEKYFPKEKIIKTGMPLRLEMFSNIEKSEALKKLGLREGYWNILVFGGSQGARHINNVFINSLKSFSDEKIQFICLTGEKEFLRIKEDFGIHDFIELNGNIVKLIPYLEDIKLVYSIADLVVSRAGANTLAELEYLKKPSVIIPFPYAKDNHQEANAKEFAKSSPILVVNQSELSVEFFVSIITQFIQKKGFFEFLGSKELGEREAQDSAEKVAKVIESVYKKNRFR